MTDQPPTDIELASAYLDGEVSPDERARVEADPELMAQVDELRAIAEALRGGLTPLTDDRAAEQRRRAIQAGRAAPPAAPAAPRRRTWLPAPVAAAAVIVVIALVGVWLLVAAGGGGSNDDLSSAGSSSGARTESAPTQASTTSSGSATPTGAGTGLTDLGAFSTRAGLTAALGRVDVTSLDAASAAPPDTGDVNQSTAAINRCEAAVHAGQPELGDRLAVAIATYKGRRVFVFSNPVNGKSAPRTQLSVSDAETCRVLFAIQR
jgi:anti-sigma factor RsiW